MTFEEFFKKKRIDLAVLESANGGLFSEFKTHYGQMGEKSFDHSKKYWFNKLRRQFPLAPEIKTEKVHIENPLAEQTVTESLIETTTSPPAPKLGFVPKFRAGNMAKPAVNTEDKKEEPASTPIAESKPSELPVEESTHPKELPVEQTEVKPAYKPRFSMKSMPPKPPEETT